MVKKLLIACSCVGLLSGCYNVNTSQTPIPTAYPSSEQQKMQAAHHWDVLAEYEAKLITASLKQHNLPVYFESTESSAPFYSSYKNLLTSQLVKHGAVVRTVSHGAGRVTFTVDVIEHKDRDSRRTPPGSWALLAGGVVVAAHAVDHWSTPAKLLIPAAVAADLYSGNWIEDTDFEVVITTQVQKGVQLVHSSSNIYYINGGDADHYSVPEKKTRKIRLTDQG